MQKQGIRPLPLNIKHDQLKILRPCSGNLRPVTSLRHQEGRRVLQEGPKFF